MSKSKRIIIPAALAAVLLAVILCLIIGKSGQTVSPDDVSTQSAAQFDYAETVKQYYSEKKEYWENLGYPSDGFEEYYYCIKDINADGTDELIICDSPDSGDNTVSALYTVCDGAAEKVFMQERHGTYSITADGYIEFHYHNIDLYALNGKELAEIYSTPRASSYENSYEEMHGEYEKYKIENGFSADYMTFDFTKYHFGE